MSKEPKMTINEIELTDAQASMIRSAVSHMQSYVTSVENREILGEIGLFYDARCCEILSLIVMSEYERDALGTWRKK